MISPSVHAARALTQAVVIALLCRRYHDLATWASEPLKQRIHFLAKADGSNLEDLYIWDSPQHLTRQQIFDFLHQHWSPEHLPLAPPEGAAAWEATPVYRKRLDQETIQALVPIGRTASDSTNEETSLLAVVLYAEQDVQDEDESSSVSRIQGENGLCWKYHNVISILQSDLAAHQWELMSDICHAPMNKPLTKSPTGTQEERKEDEDDSDDDYWGQYGDEDSPSEGEEVSTQHSRKHTEGEVDEDDEDEYWHKYSQQQEKEEAAETKRKMEQSSSNIPEITTVPTQAPSLPGQVDSTMLSSLLQMLVQEGVQQAAAEEIQDASSPQDELVPTITATEQEGHRSEEPTTAMTTSTAYLETPPVSSPTAEDRVPSQVKAMVCITLEAAVRQAALEGLSKEQVFALLENVYQSRSSE